MLYGYAFQDWVEAQQALLFDFVITELELAITFHQLASSSSDLNTIDRNTNNARRARQAARKAMQNAILSRQPLQEIDQRLDRLQGLSEAAA